MVKRNREDIGNLKKKDFALYGVFALKWVWTIRKTD